MTLEQLKFNLVSINPLSPGHWWVTIIYHGGLRKAVCTNAPAIDTINRSEKCERYTLKQAYEAIFKEVLSKQ